jgi:hypothetical protein
MAADRARGRGIATVAIALTLGLTQFVGCDRRGSTTARADDARTRDVQRGDSSVVHVDPPETTIGSFDPALAFSALRPIDLGICGAIQRTRAKVYFDGAGAVSSVEFDANPKPPKAQASCIAKRLSIATVPSYSTPPPPRWVGWPLPSPFSE